MASRTTENTNRRSADRKASRRIMMIVSAGLMMAASASMSGDAAPGRVGVEATDAPVQVADRTLVPRRIRLIIGYKRPRLA